MASDKATEVVFIALLDRIVSGQIDAGSTLPGETALAQEFGVSRPVVRETLSRLTQAGLIETQRGGGSRVEDWSRRAGLELVPSLLGLQPSPLPDMSESLFDLREIVYSDGARLCALRAPDELITEIHAMGQSLLRQARPSRRDHLPYSPFWDTIMSGSGSFAHQLALNSLNNVTRLVMANPRIHAYIEQSTYDPEPYALLAQTIALRNGEAARAAAQATMIEVREFWTSI
ncbi:MAG: FadR family transcriptional regulator [Actinobacteria bacterium]|nr:FadR family transcriptional regulator [Actinomycetota bacterium]